MAGTKRKADTAIASDAQTTKRKRAAGVNATAATNRPRRSRGGESHTKSDPAADALGPPAAKSSASKSAPKNTKTATQEVKDAKAKQVKKGSTDSAKGKKPAQKAKKESVEGSKVKDEANKSEKAEDQGASKNSAATKTAKKKTATDGEDRAPGEVRYWLMKAEPESRIEKGVDVRFSIHDLEARTKPEPWDGVRNPMAQKNMRNMKKGDLAFFYHSNCKIPGIAGLMQIVQEHSVDESAFDEKHPYYDPKSSRDKPRWHVVHVEHLRTFDELISLRELQKHAKDDESLAGMQVLRMSRLSVSQVSAKEWDYILRELADIDPKEVKAK